jgi:urease subunit gamma/beta
MRLTPWEEERLLIFSAAELARRHRDADIPLNAPEAVALICDAMLEAARRGAAYEAIETAGRSAVRPDEVIDGVRELVDEVRLEVLMGDGTRLVVLVDPIGGGRPGGEGGGSEGGGSEGGGNGGGRPDGEGTGGEGPGAVRLAATPPVEPGAGRERRTLTVRNDSARAVRVSSHYPFDRVNRRLVFDRAAAAGFRLDLPAGTSERWEPGETRAVVIVRYGGDGGR